jgi:hypothetical protein
MSKLTNRSRIYLKKIKAQFGQYVDDSNINIDPNAVLQPNYQSAYNNVLGSNSQSFSIQPPENQATQENSGLDKLEMLSPALKIGMGIKGLVESGRDRRYQKFHEKEYEKDLMERKNQMKSNSFYMTPYTAGRTSDLTMKKGGQVYQQGGTTPMDAFMNFYNTQEQSKKQILQTLEEGYSDKNEALEAKWRGDRANSWKSIGEGATFAIDAAKQAAGMMMQEGGDIPESEDLYSENFVSPYEVKEQVENELKTESPGENMQGNSTLMSWLFEEEPLQTYTVSDIYDAKYSKPASSNSDIPVRPLVDQFSSMGIQVGSINTGTHNPGSKHYSGRAFDIPGSKNGGKEGLYKIYNYLNSPEGKRQFPNIKVLNEIEKPAGKVGDANHLHIELLD